MVKTRRSFSFDNNGRTDDIGSEYVSFHEKSGYSLSPNKTSQKEERDFYEFFVSKAKKKISEENSIIKRENASLISE